MDLLIIPFLNRLEENVFLLDSKGGFLFVNDSAKNYLFHEKGLTDLPKNIAEWSSLLNFTSIQEEFEKWVVQFCTKNKQNNLENLSLAGPVDAMIYFYPLSDRPENIQFLLVMKGSKEVSLHQKNQELNKELIKQKQLLIQSSKMAQIGELTGGIAHEINNPITIIKGYTQYLEELLDQNEGFDMQALLQATAMIIKTVDKIAAIIKSMRTMARDGGLDPFESCVLNDVVKETLQFFQETLRSRHIDLELEELNENITLECKNVQLSQILINLINNAKDAIAQEDDKWIKVSLWDDADDAYLSVSDSAPLIPSELANRIMEPFFTTKPQGEGTGIGLSIAKTIVHHHKGELILDQSSEFKKFIIKIPKNHTP